MLRFWVEAGLSGGGYVKLVGTAAHERMHYIVKMHFSSFAFSGSLRITEVVSHIYIHFLRMDLCQQVFSAILVTLLVPVFVASVFIQESLKDP